MELINKLITENPDVTDPEKFEEIDALICSLSYFIKDFQRALKNKLIWFYIFIQKNNISKYFFLYY